MNSKWVRYFVFLSVLFIQPSISHAYGCVSGDCQNGYGKYQFSEGWSLSGRWAEGLPDGKMKQIGSTGNVAYRYWDDGEEITEAVRKCKIAKTTVNAYKGFASVLNAVVAAASDRNILEDAAWGYDAAGKQIFPRAVEMFCD